MSFDVRKRRKDKREPPIDLASKRGRKGLTTTFDGDNFSDNPTENQDLNYDELAISFLRLVLPPEKLGYYCVSNKAQNGRQKGKWSDHFCTTIDELYEKIQEFVSAFSYGVYYDVYFALSVFSRVGGDSKLRRLAEAATHIRSFFLDVEVSAKKAATGEGYSTFSEAHAAIETFCKAHKWPLPARILSGHGIHCHWPLAEVLSIAEWSPAQNSSKLSAGVVRD